MFVGSDKQYLVTLTIATIWRPKVDIVENFMCLVPTWLSSGKKTLPKANHWARSCRLPSFFRLSHREYGAFRKGQAMKKRKRDSLSISIQEGGRSWKREKGTHFQPKGYERTRIYGFRKAPVLSLVRFITRKGTGKSYPRQNGGGVLLLLFRQRWLPHLNETTRRQTHTWELARCYIRP